MSKEWPNNINYNNSNNIYTLTKAKEFHKTRSGLTHQQTDIATYRAAITAKKNNILHVHVTL